MAAIQIPEVVEKTIFSYESYYVDQRIDGNYQVCRHEKTLIVVPTKEGAMTFLLEFLVSKAARSGRVLKNDKWVSYGS